jgi:SAM-dependent methyltransferase/uncharacterized protein YbaR (Trm112 family)
VNHAPPLVCPRDKAPLAARTPGGALACASGHVYPVVRGVPVLLPADATVNHRAFETSRAEAEAAGAGGAGGAGEGNGAAATTPPPAPGEIDRYVQAAIVATNGNLYRGLHGKLSRYPIPAFPIADGGGRLLLDLGCNWGRWCVAAERAGFHAVGVDPDLRAVEAARRVSRQLGATPELLVGDARALPFPDRSFDVVFSYSVLQHFSPDDVGRTLGEAARVLRPGGTMLVQMANILGVRQLFNQARDLLRRERGVFRVRRWLPWQLLGAFEDAVGPATLSPDGFFTLNPQATDLDLLPAFPRLVVQVSSALRGAARRLPPLRYLADSVYIEAHKR